MDNTLVLEAAKLLKQMRDEAMTSVKETVLPKDNTFKITGFSYSDPSAIAFDRVKYFLTFALNGTVYNAEGDIDGTMFRNKEAIAKELYSKMASQVQQMIVQEMHKAFNPISK